MEMRDKLVQQQQKQQNQQISQFFIARYNNVVDVYNQSNKTPSAHLEHLDNSLLFQKINRYFSKALIKIAIVLVLVFAPGFNLFILGFLFFYFLFLRKQGKTHSKNVKRVKNPMDSFYFLPDVCHQLGKHCTTLQIKLKDVQGFTFNSDLYMQLKRIQNQSQSVTVTIYDQYFYDSFHLLKKQEYKIMAWLLISIVLIVADVLFYIAIFDLY